MKKNKILSLTVIVLLVMSFLFAGCSQQNAPAASEKPSQSASVSAEASQSSSASESVASGKKIKIGFSIQDISNPVWANMWTHMQEKAKALGVEITLSDAQADPNKQIAAIENFIESKVDAMIVHCFDSKSATETLQKAKDKGIKVIAYDTKVDLADSYFGLDNVATGKRIAKNASKFIKEKFPDGKVEVGVCNYPLNQVCLDRAKGIVEGMKEYAPNATIVAEAQAGYTNEGVKVGENFMQAHPNMKVIVGIDDAGLLGVYESIVAAGKTADDMGLFGIDALPEALKLISENTIYRSTINCDLNATGEQMVQTAYDLTQGKQVEKVVYFPQTDIDITNVKDYIK